jgi:hypothetical protein
MLSASNEDMKAYWCNEVFAKVYFVIFWAAHGFVQ